MRTDVDDVMGHLKFRKGLDNKTNRAACRADLVKLIEVGRGILGRRTDVVSGPQNEAAQCIESACVALQDALRTHGSALLTRIGHSDGRLVNIDDNPMPLLRTLEVTIFALWQLARKADVPTKRGAPIDGRRVEFLRECTRFFEQWSDGKISSSQGSIFSRFVSALFSMMQIANSADMRGSIDRMLQETCR